MLTHKPDFIVAGAPKCGTTSLYHYLSQHPEIYLPDQKELHYFARQELLAHTGGPGDEAAVRNVCRSASCYEDFFRPAEDGQTIGEVTPSYFVYPESADRILRDCGKEMKILVMLRNPVEKAYSQYLHLVKEGRETLPFPEALKAESERAGQRYNDFWRYTQSSMYADRMEYFLDSFGRDRVKVVLFEDFIADTGRELEKICEFIQVNSSFEFDTSRKYNPSGVPMSETFARFISGDSAIKKIIGYLTPDLLKSGIYERVMRANTGKKPKLSPETRGKLKTVFKPDIRQLESLLGLTTGWIS